MIYGSAKFLFQDYGLDEPRSENTREHKLVSKRNEVVTTCGSYKMLLQITLVKWPYHLVLCHFASFLKLFPSFPFMETRYKFGVKISRTKIASCERNLRLERYELSNVRYCYKFLLQIASCLRGL